MIWFWRKKKTKKTISGQINPISFSMGKGVPIIEIKINGKKAKLLIDTGASLNILAKEDSRNYKFNVYSLRNASEITGIGGTKQMLGVSKAKITIDDVDYRIPFKSISLRIVKRKLGIVGIIGSRWLNQQDYVIDYNTNTIYKTK